VTLRAALFDFDGTLVNSDPAHLAAFNELLAPYGRQMSQHHYDSEVIGRSNAEIFTKLFPQADPGEVVALGDEKEAAYLRRVDLVEVRQEAEAVFQRLRANDIRIALVTNAPRDVVIGLTERFGLLPYFDVTVTVDDVERGKPHPDPYLQALEKLGLRADQAIAIEDSLPGQRSAEAAGLPVLLLPPASNTVDESPVRSAITSLHGVLERFGL
jgi:HAD superfamily hydrolase (TIGR01509 family)